MKQFNNAALRWLNDLSAQGILMTDSELNIRSWNSWLESHSGRSAQEMVGLSLLEAYPELVARRLDGYYTDALAGQVRVISQRLHGYLLLMPPSSGDSRFSQMQQSARIAPLIDEGQIIGTITVIDDVTERVQRESELEQLLTREQLARAESDAANRSKDEFLATVSHELRTPLNAILGWVQILRAGKVDGESAAHALEAVERNSKAQAKLIEDILDASRIITGKLQLDARPVDMVAVIESALDTLRPAAEAKSIELTAELDPRLGPASGDPARLQQVMWNLISNAIKFTPKQGRVRVLLGSIDSQLEIKVIDTGPGINADFLPFVFDRFRQADSTSTRRHGGLGLGLAIVRHLVEMHGGAVSAQSEGQDKGATFTVRLPLMAVHLPANSVGAGSSPAQPGAFDKQNSVPILDGVRVLVVDDEADAREMLNVPLLQRGAEVKTASSAAEGLELLSQWQPHVLVSDIGMPGEDGYSLIARVRSLAPESGGLIPAVALTGYAGPKDRIKLLSAGYQRHIAKPVELTELVKVVASLAGRDRQIQATS